MFKTVATLEIPPQAEAGCKAVTIHPGFESKYDISCAPGYYVRQPYVLVPVFFIVVLVGLGVIFIRKRSAKLKWVMLLCGLAVIVSGVGLFLGRQWLVVNYYRPKVEQAVTKSIEPLQDTFGAMGFKDLTRLDTDCGYQQYPSDKPTPQAGTALTCSSKVDRLVTAPAKAAAKSRLVEQASQLDEKLRAQDWRLESKKATNVWFEILLSGKEFQPNQSYAKTFGDIVCGLDFLTAYSEPDPPAFSMVINCSKEVGHE